MTVRAGICRVVVPGNNSHTHGLCRVIRQRAHVDTIFHLEGLPKPTERTASRPTSTLQHTNLTAA